MTAAEPIDRVRAWKTRDQVEEELRESEERFRAFVTASSDFVYRMSPDWTEVRQLAGRTFRPDTAEPSRGWLERYIHPDDQPMVRAAIERAIETKSMFELEHRVIRADGSPGWTFSRAVPVLAANGEIKEWLGTASEVTARREAAAALRESEEELRHTIELNPQITWTATPDGKMDMSSERWADWTGSHGLGEEWHQVQHPDDFPLMYEKWMHGVRTGEPVDIEHRVRIARDGVWRWMRSRAYPRRDDEGRILKWYGTTEDIHDRKLADAALAASEEKYRTIFDSIDEGFCLVEMILDETGKPVDLLHLEANQAYERHTGLRDIVGKRALEIVPEPGPWLEFYGNVALTGEAARNESYLAAPVDRWIASYATRIGGEGSLKVAIVFNDVTLRKRAEATLRESEERQAFLLKLSDALRTETGVQAVGNRAVKMIAERLRVDRVYLVTLTPGDDTVVVTHETRRGDLPPLKGSYRGSDFPSAMKDIFERTIAYDDVRTDSRLTDLDRASFAGLDAVGFIAASIRRGTDAMIWAAGAVSTRPRSWTAAEISLFEDAVERTWAAVERACAEEELRESEQKFRTLADTAPAFIWFNDEVGANVFVNQAFLDYTGRSAEQVVGHRWHDLIHPDQAQSLVESYLEAVRAQTPWRGRNLLRRADGVWHWCDNYARPLFRSDGSYRGHVGVLIDVDDKVRAEQALRESEERQAFLLDLTDALRPLTEPGEIERQATRLLGEHLKADRCFLSPVYDDGSGMCVREEYLRAGASSVLGDYTFAQFGDFVGPELHAGRVLAIENVDALPGLNPAERASYATVEIGAYLLIPLIRDGRLAAFLTINHRTPRPWSDADKAVARQTADRLWTARERVRAEASLRESEAKYRTLFETMEEGYGLCEVIRDSAGQVIDWRYLELNPAFERHSGMGVQAVVGHLFSELFPDTDRSYWLGIYQTVMDTQSSRSFEDYWAPIDRWIAGEASPAGGERFYVIYRDVTERKRAELALRDSEERQAFLLKLSDALRPISDPVEIQRFATRMLGKQLRASRIFYVNVGEDGETADILGDYTDGVESRVGRYALSSFSTYALGEWRAGRNASSSDVVVDPRYSEAEREAYASVSTRAGFGIPLIKEGRLEAILGVNQSSPRRWTDEDVGLAGAVAERTWAALDQARAETALRESDERQAFLLALSDDLRPLEEPRAIQTIAMRHLAERLQVERAGYYDLAADQNHFKLTAKWERDGAPPLDRFQLTDFGSDVGDGYRAGRTMVMRDASRDAGSDETRATYRSIGVGARVGVPLVKGGRLLTVVALHSATPRDWTPAEIELVESVAERTCASVERARAEAALRESEALRRVALDGGRMGTWRWDLQNGLIWGDALFLELWGVPASKEPHTLSLFTERMSPEGAAEMAALVDRAIEAKEEFDGQLEIVAGPTAGCWIRWRGRAEVATPSVLYGVSFDVTEQRQAEQRLRAHDKRQQVLVAELQHRTRNLLAVVRAMADKTMARSTDLADFRARYGARLAALARVQGLLSRLAEGERITFDSLLRSELSALSGETDRVTLSGPDGVALRSSTVQTFALALHELATNAVKYGALSQARGRLAIAWRLARAEDGWPALHVDWRESGVQMPAAGASQGGGSGRELIERALPYQLGAKTTFVMEADGIHCTITLPVSDKQAVRESVDA